jgi:hypothetical protein
LQGFEVLFRAFIINVEISTNRLISTSWKIGTQPLIRGDGTTCGGEKREVEGGGGMVVCGRCAVAGSAAAGMGSIVVQHGARETLMRT